MSLTDAKKALVSVMHKSSEIDGALSTLFVKIKKEHEIDELRYVYIDKNGRYFCVTNAPEESEDYLEHDIFALDPFCFYDTLEAMPETGHIKGLDLKEHKYLDVFSQWHEFVGIHQPIYIKRKLDDGIECFIFGLADSVEDVTGYCLKHLLSLYDFVPVFSQMIAPYRQKHIDDCPNLSSIRSKVNAKQIAKQLVIDNPTYFLLSKREKQCVSLYLRCKTSAEIAKELNISSRTVEMHIHNILKKTDCRSRSELYERLQFLI